MLANQPQRTPGFSSICRILKYMKKVFVMNPEHGHPGCPPLVDYCDIEAGYSNKFAAMDGITESFPSVCEIPFQMFAYKLVEQKRTSRNGGFPFTPHWLPDEEDDLHVIMQNNSGTRHRRLACSEVMDRNDLRIFSDQQSVASEIPHSKKMISISSFSLSHFNSI
ncbi:unnamed protein product [Cuscuta epithymum]|uniref:Uncharacterized protein n=1 Tax=Cuscuta epithymum TaxID=186058 RepID=A0AAV0D7X9_9ASTE|nr:unnamed protein product [Cuscuta epithymum]